MLFKFNLNGVDYEYDVEKECAIELTNLQDELVKHPSKVAFIGAVASVLKTRAEKLKVLVDEMYAKLDVSLRNTAVERGEKLTEKFIESLIIKNDRYSALKTEYLNALEQARLAESCVEAFRHRQFALVSLVGMLKVEQVSVLTDFSRN